MTFQRIRNFVRPPQRPVATGTPEAFAVIETQLDLVLPNEYKLLINTYGDGQWQEFWYLLNPFSANQNLNLLHQAPRDDRSGTNILSAERYIRDRHSYPHAIWPEPEGIFPWAVTDNGGRFFWLLQGSPERWPSIYYPSRDPDYQAIALPISEIIAGLLSGELPLFQEEFGGETPPPTFTPLANGAG